MTETDSESTISYDNDNNHVINVTQYEHEKIRSYINKNNVEETLNKFNNRTNTLMSIHDRLEMYQLYYFDENMTQKHIVNIHHENGTFVCAEYVQDRSYKPKTNNP